MPSSRETRIPKPHHDNAPNPTQSVIKSPSGNPPLTHVQCTMYNVQCTMETRCGPFLLKADNDTLTALVVKYCRQFHEQSDKSTIGLALSDQFDV